MNTTITTEAALAVHDDAVIDVLDRTRAPSSWSRPLRTTV
jgi:hypothetical protein